MKIKYFQDTDTLYIEFKAAERLRDKGFRREHQTRYRQGWEYLRDDD